MDGSRRILDDIAKLATSAAGLVQGAGREAEAALRLRFERLIDSMDLVPRDEFDAVKAMAAEARAENERLAGRLAALEGALPSATPKQKKKPRAKPAARQKARKPTGSKS